MHLSHYMWICCISIVLITIILITNTNFFLTVLIFVNWFTSPALSVKIIHFEKFLRVKATKSILWICAAQKYLAKLVLQSVIVMMASSHNCTLPGCSLALIAFTDITWWFIWQKVITIVANIILINEPILNSSNAGTTNFVFVKPWVTIYWILSGGDRLLSDAERTSSMLALSHIMPVFLSQSKWRNICFDFIHSHNESILGKVHVSVFM